MVDRRTTPALPLPLKISFSLFMLVHVILNLRVYGWQNYLWMCDAALVSTLLGIWLESALILSAQALALFLPMTLWVLDAVCHVVRGRALTGFAGYMFDINVPISVRMLATFHIWMPMLMVYLLWKLGYHRRAWLVQSIVVIALLTSCRIFSEPPPTHGYNSPTNINWVYGPGFRHPQTRVPQAVYFGFLLIGFPLLIYLPTHLLLLRCFREQTPEESVGALAPAAS